MKDHLTCPERIEEDNEVNEVGSYVVFGIE